jgi:predicted Ser/Thr protein kinase
MATPVGFVKTGYVTAIPGGYPTAVYKKITGKYAKFYAGSGKSVGTPLSQETTLVKNASGTVKKLGAFLKANKKAKTPAPAKAPSPTKAKSPALGPYVKTNFKFGSYNKDVYKKNGEYYYYSSTGIPTLLGKEKFIKKPNGSMASLASLNKANAMAGYTKTNLKIGSLNVYKKNGDYYYKKTNGQPQKLGHASKVTKPNGTTKPIKMLNYNKTNLKFGNKNVYKNKSGNHYITNIYASNKPIKLAGNAVLTKPNGTSVNISNLSKTGKYTRLGDMMYFNDPVYYNVEGGKIKVYYKKAGSYIQFASLSSSIYKSTDTTFSKPIKIKDYLDSNNAYIPTGLSSTNGKNVYKHLDGTLSVKNGAKYTGKFKGKHSAEAMLGISKVPKAPVSAFKAAAAKPVTPAAAPPVVLSVTLVPVVKPGPDHVKAKVSEFTEAVEKVVKRLKKLQEATGGTHNKNINAKNLCSKGNGMAFMKRSNTLRYKYSKISGSLTSGSWKSVITNPKFTYDTYELKLSYSQYLAHQQLLFTYGRNVNSFENVRLSDMMDLNWFAAQDKYIRSLGVREIFTISGYSYNGDQWAHTYLDGRFDYNRFRTSVGNLGGTYFAFFFQARDFYKINTGDILKDYNETVTRVKNDKDNENIKSIIHMFINDLNEIIRKAPSVTRTFIVFRGNKDDKYLTGAVNNLYTTERFCSASVSGGKAVDSFASGHELQRITILKGSKCLLMFGITQVPGEWEILLPRGSTYQIVKRRQNMKTLENTNLCGTYQARSLKYLTDVVLLGTVEEAKTAVAVPVEVHPTTNAHVMQKYIKNWPVTITGILGKGGMGVVYQGTNTNLKKNVAIKFQKKSINSNTEKKALKKLAGLNIAPKFYKNKNIVANNYLHSEAPKVQVGNQVSVMESNLIKGPALKKWFTGTPIPKDIANKVKNAVSKMHSRGVIHGNLHRDNIIISNSNKRAYIIDFGRALVTNNSFNSPNHANAVLKTKGTLGKSHGKNTVTTPNGVFHFFNGKFINGLRVANS